MSKSTFNNHKVNISERFGYKFMDTYNQLEYLPTIGKAKREIENYLSNGYKIIPAEVWIGATYDNKPIVKMLAYNGHKEVSYIIYTRNE